MTTASEHAVHVECEEGTTKEEQLRLSNVPSMMVSNTFLDKNSQSHASAMTAFGDIIDNGRESGASKLSIEVRTYCGRPLLTMTDNGTGMTEAKVREGLMSIGYTTKDLSTGKHYGFGGKTAIPRLCDSALIFTRESQTRYRTIGLLSSVFSDRVGASETKMPLCSWEEFGSDVVSGTSEEYAPLTLSQREASGTPMHIVDAPTHYHLLYRQDIPCVLTLCLYHVSQFTSCSRLPSAPTATQASCSRNLSASGHVARGLVAALARA